MSADTVNNVLDAIRPNDEVSFSFMDSVSGNMAIQSPST